MTGEPTPVNDSIINLVLFRHKIELVFIIWLYYNVLKKKENVLFGKEFGFQKIF